jgi:hypothetical protein
MLSVINNNETRRVHQVQGIFLNSNKSPNLNLLYIGKALYHESGNLRVGLPKQSQTHKSQASVHLKGLLHGFLVVSGFSYFPVPVFYINKVMKKQCALYPVVHVYSTCMSA